jgi:hypothetical protein
MLSTAFCALRPRLIPPWHAGNEFWVAQAWMGHVYSLIYLERFTNYKSRGRTIVFSGFLLGIALEAESNVVVESEFVRVRT